MTQRVCVCRGSEYHYEDRDVEEPLVEVDNSGSVTDLRMLIVEQAYEILLLQLGV